MAANDLEPLLSGKYSTGLSYHHSLFFSCDGTFSHFADVLVLRGGLGCILVAVILFSPIQKRIIYLHNVASIHHFMYGYTAPVPLSICHRRSRSEQTTQATSSVCCSGWASRDAQLGLSFCEKRKGTTLC